MTGGAISNIFVPVVTGELIILSVTFLISLNILKVFAIRSLNLCPNSTFWDFFSHSAIKDLIWEEMTLTDHQRKRSNPTRFSRIYRETYKDQIMDKYIKKFGRY